MLPAKAAIEGLSPRGRGKPGQAQHSAANKGSIPAWAGETYVYAVGIGFCEVYPRVGGGNFMSLSPSAAALGLSPRGRGKQPRRRHGWRIGRSIPAWAGETSSIIASPHIIGVYPRVGGGNDGHDYPQYGIQGLSPRGRGKRALPRHEVAQARSIPAWAGETIVMASMRGRASVYPRVGGGNRASFSATTTRYGLSPRGRGKPVRGQERDISTRSIPAWAGETQNRIRFYAWAKVYPRVGGGNGHSRRAGRGRGGLSPRGRGKLRHFPV